MRFFGNRFAFVSRAVAALAAWIGGFVGERFSIGGFFTVSCYGPDGALRWSQVCKNGVTNVALNNVLDVYLRAVAGSAAWYIGLIDNAGYSAFAAADTMASHAGWSESSDYAAATRPQWSPGAAANQSVTNAATVDFAMNATKTIRGLFLANDNAKGGVTGTLFATAAFSGGNQAVNNGDTLKVTYTVSAASN
jgi:hypothetical protein